MLSARPRFTSTPGRVRCDDRRHDHHSRAETGAIRTADHRARVGPRGVGYLRQARAGRRYLAVGGDACAHGDPASRLPGAHGGSGVDDAIIYRVDDHDPTPALDRIADYCWAPHRLPGRSTTVYCSWPFGHDEAHVSADIRGGKARVAAIWADSEPPAGRIWSPRDRRPWVMSPSALLLSDDAWADDMAREGVRTGVNRQCSIG